MFVSDETEAVSDGQNSIHVRTRLGFGAYNEFMDELRSQVGAGSLLEHLGALNIALLAHCVAKWDGPAFQADGKAIPCTRENVLRLDPEDPLVNQAMEVIRVHNPLTRMGSDPKPDTSVGAPRPTA